MDVLSIAIASYERSVQRGDGSRILTLPEAGGLLQNAIYSRGLRHSADPLSSNRRMLDGGSCVGIILHVDAIRSSEH